MDIKYFDRYKDQIVQEKVYGAQAVEWLYQSSLGKILNAIVTSAWVSKLFGVLQQLPWSRFKVEQFCSDYGIDLDQFEPQDGRNSRSPYSSFNHFFIRRWKPEMRTFSADKLVMPAFIEGRYLGFSAIESEKIPVKGILVDPLGLIANNQWSSKFVGGPLIVGRLAPVDYHRFHFPIEGEICDSWRIHGDFHSVNPVALDAYPEIFLKNEREVTIIKTKDFGYLAYIEVGATCVGKIVQTYKGKKCLRGDEKGYFLFGGSTVILLGEPGKWAPANDICHNSAKGIETYIHLGDDVAKQGR